MHLINCNRDAQKQWVSVYNLLQKHLLNRARVAELLPRDIDLLKTRLISIDTGDIPYTLHVYPTRDAVQK